MHRQRDEEGEREPIINLNLKHKNKKSTVNNDEKKNYNNSNNNKSDNERKTFSCLPQTLPHGYSCQCKLTNNSHNANMHDSDNVLYLTGCCRKVVGTFKIFFSSFFAATRDTSLHTHFAISRLLLNSA